MTYTFNHLDHTGIPDLATVTETLKTYNCHIALIKRLARNDNDKNQVRFHKDASLLNATFDLRFSDRGESTSITKRASEPGKAIPQAVFHRFSWLDTSGRLNSATECKAIVYTQYPEARLSGFQTTEREMPRSISVDYKKEENAKERYLVIGATPSGAAVAMMCVAPGEQFHQDFTSLDSFFGSTTCKAIYIDHGTNSGACKLKRLLQEKVVGQTLKGCRYDKNGYTIPFTGTQVHGYTLEHACGIIPNADKDGDIFGIELKCFTRKKLTLFTPEPDGGLYAKSFPDFMKKYGYLKGDDYRFTGLHRAYTENENTGLTLKIYCWMKKNGTKEREKVTYNPGISITKQMSGMEVVLEDRRGRTAASWSLERLLNCWGAKHNEVVYYPATKHVNDNAAEIAEGYKYKIEFSDEVLWCKNTGAEQLFRAIHEGTVFLDPAPKYNENDASRTKRRSQWRVNNIYQAAQFLYENSKIIQLTSENPQKDNPKDNKKMKEIRLADKAEEQRTQNELAETNKLLKLLVEVYDQKKLTIKLAKLSELTEGADLKRLKIDRSDLIRWTRDPEETPILIDEKARNFIRQQLLPEKPAYWDNPDFTFTDLFAGIGGLRKGFEEAGGKCVFTSEWDQKARRTYLANHYVDVHELDYFLACEDENPEKNTSFMDITKVTQSGNPVMNRKEKLDHIRRHIPYHDVLLAGFPYQPFSVAGVTKLSSQGRDHEYICNTQGTLFFDIELILDALRPKFFVLENIKNLKSHNRGDTFRAIIRSLDRLGYWLTDITDEGDNIEQAIRNVIQRKREPTVINAEDFVPQHRERIVLVGIIKDLNTDYRDLTLRNIAKPAQRPALADILCNLSDEEAMKYTLTPNLWNYLYNYALKHQTTGSGFGFGLVDPNDKYAVTRTLSARYHKDGSEILINDKGLEPAYLEEKKEYCLKQIRSRNEFLKAADTKYRRKNPGCTQPELKVYLREAENKFNDLYGRYAPEFDPQYKTPRRLTPKECARLMGFEKSEKFRTQDDHDFRIVCADASAYRQFGNSAVVPVFRAIAQLIRPHILKARASEINTEDEKIS